MLPWHYIILHGKIHTANATEEDFSGNSSQLFGKFNSSCSAYYAWAILCNTCSPWLCRGESWSVCLARYWTRNNFWTAMLSQHYPNSPDCNTTLYGEWDMARPKYHQLFLWLANTKLNSCLVECLLSMRSCLCLPISAVPNLRLVPPSGVYVANEGSKFNLQCIADVYPVMSLMWVRILGIEIQGMADVRIMWTTVTAISLILCRNCDFVKCQLCQSHVSTSCFSSWWYLQMCCKN